MTEPTEVSDHLTYIITETSEPDSFDPIAADQTQNLPAMRMRYATPLEVSTQNNLTSAVLSSFVYEEKTHTAIFKVREDLLFSDGQRIMPRDVALAIVRFAYFKPEFPVIKNIKGIREWAEKKDGLYIFPTGLTIKENEITIEFDRPLYNPLFRFCLEVFSIIPESCIDLSTGALKCTQAPESGYFIMSSRSDRRMEFVRRNAQSGTFESIPYKSLSFVYKTMKEACSTELAQNEIIAGAELGAGIDSCLAVENKKQIPWLPAARFGVLRFNPNVAPFGQAEVRRFFSEKVRHIMKSKFPAMSTERGLFPRLLPGYLDIPYDNKNDSQTIELLRGQKIILPKLSTGGLTMIYDVIACAAETIGMNVETEEIPQGNTIVNKFLDGHFPVIFGGSGFWAQDPVGDVSMWFTKNLHETMTFVWSDPKIYEMIDQMEVSSNSFEVKNTMQAFNNYIYSTSLLAPIIHYRRFYLSAYGVRNIELPQAISSPAPWQIMVRR